MLATHIEEFIDSLKIEDVEEEIKRVKKITKRLNKSYYEDCESETEHCEIVGSLGRKTAIKSFSDVDMLFILPSSKKKQYDDHDGNGQSKLLQDVKKEIKKRYSRTIVRGDGQVVVVSFESLKKIVEVCPVFEQSDGSFLYPDANEGGSWKKTNPIPEIDEAAAFNITTNNNFSYVCYLVRAWKNNIGFKFGGLLLDTLVYKFLNANSKYYSADFTDYLDLLKDLFKYLKDLNEDQAYWYALGSKQKVYNKKCKFVKKAKKAYNKIKDLDEDSTDLYETLVYLFGQTFPVPETVNKSVAYFESAYTRATNTEEFIENKFRVDIRYSLKVDCIIKQDGYRPTFLRDLLKGQIRIKRQRTLEFFIVENEFEQIIKERNQINSFSSDEKIKFDIYWKVLNRGDEAIRRNCIRGQIKKGIEKRTESADFNGDHFVECYIVYEDTVVARDRIHVPIQIENTLQSSF
ncbi:DNA polymerase III subunit delta' [Kurthia zopfii]|uniref:Adenylyl/Guanylyl and SMODS C-terminal sensor domain-containing protein n=1 Tax=Kurthia zopfii TaxID=1650 RepID=A0A8B4QE91_9BACL|nr:nucleotidyltransferase [Kurthia zopfii]PWI22278.1 nucleotidyltransferase [Kurthia zopfii]TDR37907.1 hypothetical protein DFR61_11833 [Kurthia zopfii]GEK30517.1 DNA polymerase III subunit delta' [Kurthia zopfii]STX11076.1 Uncharacterised protein [Kurthia zopfii]